MLDMVFGLIFHFLWLMMHAAIMQHRVIWHAQQERARLDNGPPKQQKIKMRCLASMEGKIAPKNRWYHDPYNNDVQSEYEAKRL